jgi:hypothetical protein
MEMALACEAPAPIDPRIESIESIESAFNASSGEKYTAYVSADDLHFSHVERDLGLISISRRSSPRQQRSLCLGNFAEMKDKIDILIENYLDNDEVLPRLLDLHDRIESTLNQFDRLKTLEEEVEGGKKGKGDKGKEEEEEMEENGERSQQQRGEGLISVTHLIESYQAQKTQRDGEGEEGRGRKDVEEDNCLLPSVFRREHIRF